MRQFVIGTAGHIDHGKTALVKALTGINTDYLPAEQQRCITIDLGFAHLSDNITIIDVPGHERFIKNMVAGVTTIDLVLFVIAADDGVMPQTREHFDIIRLLNVPRAIFAITKCDLVEPEWCAMIREEIANLTAGTPFARAPVFPTSTHPEEGISTLKDAIIQEVQQAPDREDNELFRQPIDRVFTVKGFGTVVTGTIISGHIAVGDAVEIHPAGILTRVRGIQNHGREVKKARCGDRAAINLNHIEREKLARGMVLTTPERYQPGRVLNAELRLLPGTPAPLQNNQRIRLHLHTGETTARVILPEGELAPGASGFAQLRLKEPLHGAFGDPFIIRRLSPAMTIGGGTILQVNPVPYRKKWHERIIRQLASLKGEDHQASLMAAFDTIRIHSHTLWDLRVATGISMAEVQKQFNQLQKQGLAIPDESGSRKAFFSKAQIDLVLGAIESQLEKFHHQFPGRRGIIIEELISHLDKKLPREAVLTGVKEGISQKRLFGDHQFVCLNSFSPHLSGTDSAFYQTMLQEIREGGFAPLTIREFQEKLGISGGAMRELVGQLRQEGHIFIAEDNFVFDSGLLEHLKEILTRHFEQNEELSVADFRTHLGITRKHAMPLLTYLDRCNWTQRKDPVRVKGPELTTD